MRFNHRAISFLAVFLCVAAGLPTGGSVSAAETPIGVPGLPDDLPSLESTPVPVLPSEPEPGLLDQSAPPEKQLDVAPHHAETKEPETKEPETKEPERKEPETNGSASRHSETETTPARPDVAPFYEEESDSQATAVVSDYEEGADFCGVPMCGPPGRVWLRADYLMWWTNGTHLPPLVTSDPDGVSAAQAGVLPNATVLFGDRTVGNDGRFGIRSTLGVWLDSCHTRGIEFDYFSLGERANGFTRYSPRGSPILARPFFNVQTNREDCDLVSYANQPNQSDLATGWISVDVKEYFQSAGVLAAFNIGSSETCNAPAGSCDAYRDEAGSPAVLRTRRMDLLVGFRYYNLSDRVVISEDRRDLDPTSSRHLSVFEIEDSFAARNDFYGSEIGLRTLVYRGRWSLELTGKIAVGDTHAVVDIHGQTSEASVAGATQAAVAGGTLATASNSGSYQRDVFTMIPQLNLELGYQINNRWRAYAGYNILYWGCVSRAADQISLYADPRGMPSSSLYAPTAALPFPALAEAGSSFWAHGLNLGAEFRF